MSTRIFGHARHWKTLAQQSAPQSPARRQPQFGMQQPLAARQQTPKTGCWQALKHWLNHLFPSRSAPVADAEFATPLIHQPAASLSSTQFGQRVEPDQTALIPENRAIQDPLLRNGSLSSDAHSAEHRPSPLPPSPSTPIRISPGRRSARPRLIESTIGLLTRVREEGDLEFGKHLALRDDSGCELASLTLKPTKHIGSAQQEFHPLALDVSKAGQNLFNIASESIVTELLLKSALQLAQDAGLSMMVHPKSVEESAQYRELGFKPLGDILGETPPSRYANHLAVDFSHATPGLFQRQDSSDEFYVGSPPGLREERQKRLRWAEQHDEYLTEKPDKKSKER